MANEELANALERNRSLNEENVRLTRELDLMKNELESALSLCGKSISTVSVVL